MVPKIFRLGTQINIKCGNKVKQILQNLKTGMIDMIELPVPMCKPGHIVVASKVSLLSSGTERMLLDFGKSSLFKKAQKQPDKVKQVFDKARVDGIVPTVNAVLAKLNQSIPMGYCNVGTVLETEVDGYRVGDRVISNGHHAEIVRIPKHLCAKIPDQVDDDSAVFTPLAAIALQGVRLANPTIGEFVVVQGLGIIGLLTAQILRINGCRVIGLDIDSARCELASSFGIETIDMSKWEAPAQKVLELSFGVGADAVLVCTSSSKDDIMHLAADMCRIKARIVLIGTAGLNFRRDDFYKKEINFQVSSSYGPGRYDRSYEEGGHDYPIGYVRWTQQRNFEAILNMMASGNLVLTPLISKRFEFDEAKLAYDSLEDPTNLGILIDYKGSEKTVLERTISLSSNQRTNPSRRLQGQTGGNHLKQRLAFIGSGNYASKILIPAFNKAGAKLDILVGDRGISSVQVGIKAGFVNASTDINAVFDNPQINGVVIATQHHDHAAHVIRALKSPKHVFVEKPLCLTTSDLLNIRESVDQLHTLSSIENSITPVLMVGFNRRFAPHIQKIKSLIEPISLPKAFIMTVNAGAISSSHWTQDKATGGGRILGEACHFIDLLRYLSASPISSSDIGYMNTSTKDTATISLKFVNGSIGTIHYFSNGHRAVPKERLEVYVGQRNLVLDNFRQLRGHGWPRFSKMNLWRQNKGHQECVQAFLRAISGQDDKISSPIPFEEIFEVSEVAIKLSA